MAAKAVQSVVGVGARPQQQAAVAQPAGAAPAENAGGVDAASSPLIQELLRRTEEKKEERRKERLEDYYRRNYGDYLSFQAGSAPASDISENQSKIREWLDRNLEPALPFEAAQQRRQEAAAE